MPGGKPGVPDELRRYSSWRHRMTQASRFKLVVQVDGAPRWFDLEPGVAIVGRSPDSPIQIDHESISRQHCEVRFSEDGVELKDLGSSNGTWVNGQKINRQWVRPEDRITFGRVEARVEPLDAEVQQPGPAEPAGPSVSSDSSSGARGPGDGGGSVFEEIAIESAAPIGVDSPEGASKGMPPARTSGSTERSDYVLVVVDGDHAGERFPLMKTRQTVGRASSNDIQVKGLGVSGTHAEIVWEGAAPVLRDLDSTNGILQAGRRITEARLRHGLTLHIGKVGIRIEGPVDEIEIGLDDSPVGEVDEGDETLQFRHLTESAVPKRRRVGGLLIVTILVMALAAAAYFRFVHTTSRKSGQTFTGVEVPAGSLIRTGFSGEEVDIAEIWPMQNAASGELSRSAAARRTGRFGMVLERSTENGPLALAVYRDRIAVDSRRRYALTGMVRRQAGTVEATLMIRFRSASGVVVQEIFGPRVTADTWQTVELTPTVPEECTTAELALVGAGGKGTAYFEDIVLRASELTARVASHALNRFRVTFSPHGSWSLRIDNRWPIRRANYVVQVGETLHGLALRARPTGDGLVSKDGVTRFTGQMEIPGQPAVDVGLTVEGTGDGVFTYQPWKGEGAAREGIAFEIDGKDVKEGILVSSGNELTVQNGPFSMEAVRCLVVGKKARKVRLLLNPPLDVQLLVEGGTGRVFLSRRPDRSEPIVLTLNTSLIDLQAGAISALDKGREALKEERFGDAYRNLNRVIRDFGVKIENIEEARQLVAQVETRFRERFDQVKKQAANAEFFKDNRAVGQVLHDAMALQRTYRDTPVEVEAQAVVERLMAVRKVLVDQAGGRHGAPLSSAGPGRQGTR